MEYLWPFFTFLGEHPMNGIAFVQVIDAVQHLLRFLLNDTHVIETAFVQLFLD